MIDLTLIDFPSGYHSLTVLPSSIFLPAGMRVAATLTYVSMCVVVYFVLYIGVFEGVVFGWFPSFKYGAGWCTVVARGRLGFIEGCGTLGVDDAFRPLQKLPACNGVHKAPPILGRATEDAAAMSAKELHEFRAAAKQHWTERKRVLDQIWPSVFAGLPDHIKSVIGPKKICLCWARCCGQLAHQILI